MRQHAGMEGIWILEKSCLQHWLCQGLATGKLFIPCKLSFLMCKDRDKGPCFHEPLQRLSEQMQKTHKIRNMVGAPDCHFCSTLVESNSSKLD